MRPGPALWEQVTRYLKTSYSPEQIAETLGLVHTDTPWLQVSHGTLYITIYAIPRGTLRTAVCPFGHAKRHPQARGEDPRGRIPDMVSIHDLPSKIEKRVVTRHWEGDLIKGAHTRSAVKILVERTYLAHGVIQDGY
ncbi:MAG TPA: hypothetical protein VK901_20725 [Nitrospiraceae bacterium]|nr:hypothetical protein [Nitrospiraceae bacterium]